MRTAAEGLQTRVGFELPQEILRERLENLCSSRRRRSPSATRQMIERTRNLIERAARPRWPRR